MPKKLPVYDIGDFKTDPGTPEFYANKLSIHVATHLFSSLPHKHDFFMVMIVSKGSGTHEIDFINYKVKPGSVFVMQPGQMHYWDLSPDIEGHVFFHSRTFYEETPSYSPLRKFPFFSSFNSVPSFLLSPGAHKRLTFYLEELLQEYGALKDQRMQKIRALLNIVYIELSRNYGRKNSGGRQGYQKKLREFETLIDQNFKKFKSAGDYARLLSISEKHLNRIVKGTLNKTSTQVIAERIILETRRMLIQEKMTVTEIGYALGFADKSYFVRFFKKHTKETPLGFLRRYKK